MFKEEAEVSYTIINGKKVFSYIPIAYKYSELPLEIPKRLSFVSYEIEGFVESITKEYFAKKLDNGSNKISSIKCELNNLVDYDVSKIIINSINKINLKHNKNLTLRKKTSYAKYLFFSFPIIFKIKLPKIFSILPSNIKQMINEDYLIYGHPKKRFLIFIKFLISCLPPFLIKDLSDKINKKTNEFNKYGNNKRKEKLNVDYILTNFSIDLNKYIVQELDQNFIQIKSK